MNLTYILTSIGTVLSIISFIYFCLKSVKTEIKADLIEFAREIREDTIAFMKEMREDRISFKNEMKEDRELVKEELKEFKSEIRALENRMFLMATGRKLEDVLLEERMKQSKNNQSEI